MRRMICGLALVAMATLTPICASAEEQADKDSAQKIAAVLRDSGRMQNYSVGVKCKDGTVWLNGRVTSNEQLSTALQIVSDVDGVQQIVNNLTIGAGRSAGKQAGASSRRNAQGVQLATAQQPMQAPAPMPMGGGGGASQAGYRQLPPGPMAGMGGGGPTGAPMPAYVPAAGNSPPPAAYDQPHQPNYAWPSYAASPNYAAVTYPKQYSATAWPFIGPFYPYPQVPMGWRKVSLEWDDGWWFLDFDDRACY